jgi:hypothetical protein
MMPRQPEVPNLIEVMLEFTLLRVFAFQLNCPDKLKLELQLNYFQSKAFFFSA